MNKKIDGAFVVNLGCDELLSMIRLGLEHSDLLVEGGKKTNVKEVSLYNGGDTVLVEFYAINIRSSDIKVEIAVIMAYLSSALKGELYQDLDISFFGAKAFDKNDVEIMHAVCSKSVASTITDGDPFNWLKSTIFQENTDDYRLARAKTMISDIENGLRKTISDIYSKKMGSNWWDNQVESKVSSSIKNTYSNQFGITCSDGGVLIKYAFTLDIKKIISADWGTFRHLFHSKTSFESSMADLNVIRREEAHNRLISEQHLVDLEKIYTSLLEQIADTNPDIRVQYLLENWHSKIKKLMIFPPRCVYTTVDFGKQDLFGKQELLLKDTNHQVIFWADKIAKLKSLNPPLTKRALHNKLISILEELLQIQKQKLHCIETWKFDDAVEISSLLTTHLRKMDDFSKDFLLSES